MLRRIPFTVCLGTLLAILSIPIQLCMPVYAEETEPECWAVIIGVSHYPCYDYEYCECRPDGEGTGLVFTSWNNGGTSASRAVSHGGEYIADYQRQYQLTIESAYGDPKGEGWYDSGSTAAISITSPEGAMIRRVFTGWSGDFTGTVPAASLIMDAPKRLRRTGALITCGSACA